MSDQAIGRPRAAGDSAGSTRVEHDFLGEVEVPASALYGVGTRRAMLNSGVGGDLLSEQPLLLQAMAEVKAAAALANASLGLVPGDVAAALVAAADELAAGALDEHLPLEIVQGGGGTAANTNVNEVLANRASQLLGAGIGADSVVDVYRHVNRSQSTNDVFPTAMGLAVYRAMGEALTALDLVRRSLLKLADEHEGLEHLARSCLQDAVPALVSDLHRNHEAAVRRACSDLDSARQRLLDVPLGGTVVGTGLGAPAGYLEAVLDLLRERTGLPVSSAINLGDGIASLEPFAAAADAASRAGRTLARVAADLRLLASGPVGGIGEVILPSLQAGSSIMPGKVNPVLPELVMQTSYLLAGAAHTVALASGSTDLEVTPMGPVVAHELLRALSRLANVATLFSERCLTGLRWHRENVALNLTGSFADAVHASSVIGFAAAARARRDEADAGDAPATRPGVDPAASAGTPNGRRR